MKSLIVYPNRGFTIIELLVVIVVIGVLAAIVIVAYNGVQNNANDSRRLSDAQAIAKALFLYNEQTGSYPPPGTNTTSGWQSSAVNPSQFISQLKTAGLLNIVPVDPVNIGTAGSEWTGKVYDYYRYSAGSYSCDSSRGAFFVFGVTDMETSTRPHPKSPGWACGTRNWQGEFDWVIGGYEK